MKRKYNKWLYKKYGCNMENVPMIFKIIPLFSPSIYMANVGEELKK